MNGRIRVVVLMLLAMWPGAWAADCDGEDQGKARQVGQKLDLLARLLDDSEPVRRAQREGNEEALEGALRTHPACPLLVSNWPQQHFASHPIRQRDKYAKPMKERCNSPRVSCYLSKHSPKTCAD
jgi:hypothetical protein